MGSETEIEQRPALITGADLAAMGDIGRCELVEGRIVPMLPTGGEHGVYEGNLYAALRAFVRSRGLGKVMVGEVGVYVRRNPDTVRGADVAFVSHERLAGKDVSPGFLEVAPDLVVEIVSPGDRWSEIMQKLREYLEAGVRLVWIVDPEARLIYAFRALDDMRTFAAGSDLPGDDVLPGFSVPVAELLAA